MAMAKLLSSERSAAPLVGARDRQHHELDRRGRFLDDLRVFAVVELVVVLLVPGLVRALVGVLGERFFA